MFETKNIGIFTNSKYLIKNLSFTLNKGDKLAIIGEEGNGKSTLLKALLNKCDYASITSIINNHNHTIGYLEQTTDSNNLTQYAYTYLFIDENDYYNKISNLSNGTKAKLILTKLVIEKCNVLILDEPTRNVSPLSNPVIRKVLKNFNGTIISISHDRKYISEVADTIYELTESGLKEIIN